MSILNVNTIQPIGSGTTVTVAATELKTSNFITVGTGASVTSPSANVLTLGTNNAERFRIDSAGKVGVGINDPARLLHLHESNSNEALITFTTPTTGATASDGFRVGMNGSEEALVWNNESGVIKFGTANTERLRITSAGSVAIGVNSPSDKLHVGGNNAFIRVDRPNGNPGLTLIYNSTNSTRADIDLTTGGDLRFATNNSTERLRIDSGGRIAQGGRTPTNHGSPNLLLWGADPTLHISATGSTANTSFAGIKFAVAGGSTGDYSKAGIFVQRQDSYNDLDMIFAFRSSNDATGVSVSDEKIRINSDGHVLPGANNTYDLGSTAKGWRNVYMNDLNLSNMNGDTNDVDGTQGSWTIQEGKDDLYIINRLNGKKFKIKMEEIS